MIGHYIDLAWRSIKRTPFISLLMVLAISAGVGMTVTMFSIYQHITANPAEKMDNQPFTLQLQSNSVGSGWRNGMLRQISYQDAMAIRDSGLDATTVAMFKSRFAIKSDAPTASPIFGSVRVTDGTFFDIFEVPFIAGSTWTEHADRDGDYVAVISQARAELFFGSDDPLGRMLFLDNKPYRVIGVIEDFNPQPKFYDLNNNPFSLGAGIYIPMGLAPLEEISSSGNTNGWEPSRIEDYQSLLTSELHWLQFWVSFDSQQERVEFERWLSAYIGDQQSAGRFPNPEASFALQTPAQWIEYMEVHSEESDILLIISILFLLVCIVNTIGLLLGKFLKAAPAVGTRRALGASQGQIFLQHIVEVSLIGLAGGLIGLVFATGVLHVLNGYLAVGFAGDEFPLTQLHWTMWLYSPAIALLSSVIAGLIPAWRICRMPPSLYLKIQ